MVNDWLWFELTPKQENSNFETAVASVEKITDKRLLKIQLPWGEKDDFNGIVNLLDMKAYAAGSDGGVEIPAELADAAAEARMELVEAAAEGDDALMEKYFEDGELTSDEIIAGLKAAVQKGLFVPVLMTDVEIQVGIRCQVIFVVCMGPTNFAHNRL